MTHLRAAWGSRAVSAVTALLLTCTATTASAQTDVPEAGPEAFIGVFRLAEYAAHGDEPIGRISYDGAGRMWAMLFPPGREPVSNESADAEYRAAMRGLIAYYGTYEVDEAGGRVIHHVEAASNPLWIGAEFVRWYRFEDGNLRLSLNPEFNNPLLWQRLP
jgi:hypothetical protein